MCVKAIFPISQGVWFMDNPIMFFDSSICVKAIFHIDKELKKTYFPSLEHGKNMCVFVKNPNVEKRHFFQMWKKIKNHRKTTDYPHLNTFGNL